MLETKNTLSNIQQKFAYYLVNFRIVGDFVIEQQFPVISFINLIFMCATMYASHEVNVAEIGADFLHGNWRHLFIISPQTFSQSRYVGNVRCRKSNSKIHISRVS